MRQGVPLLFLSGVVADLARERATRGIRFACVLLLAAAVHPVFAQPCNFIATAPANWARVDASVATLRLPRDAYLKRDGAGDADSVRYVADGLDVLVDYGPARQPPEPESGMVSRMLGGAPAFIVSEAHADGAGRIAITWIELGHPRLEANVTIDYADASRRTDACRIASNLHLLGSSNALTLLRTGRASGQRYAVLRDADGRERRIVEGDYVALNWGKVTRIDERTVQIVERVPETDGRWTQRETLLRAR
jgi:hypothetical protein